MPGPAVSQTEICNLALSHIAQRPIETIEDANSVQAVQCKRVWNTALKEALASHDWGFCTVIKPLVLSATYTPLGWLYAYQHPPLAVAIWHVYNEATTDVSVGEEFRQVYDPDRNEQVIVTNCAEAYAEYSSWITDTAQFEPRFVTAFAYRLAAELAIPLVGDPGLAAQMTAGFNAAVNDAERMSSYENYEQPHPHSDILDARE